MIIGLSGLGAEAASVEDSADSDRLRSELRNRAYAARYGAINRFSTRATGRTDPATGEPRLARVSPRVMHTLRSDPFAPLVMALESFDETTQTAVPATLLSQRTLVARVAVLGVYSPPTRRSPCAWRPTAASTSSRSPACSAPVRTRRATRSPSSSTTTLPRRARARRSTSSSAKRTIRAASAPHARRPAQ